MSHDVAIREMKAGDVEAMEQIAIAAWTPIAAFSRKTMGEDLYTRLNPDWKQRKGGQVRRACEPESGAMVRVAEKGGRIVGFVTFHANMAPGVGEIGNNAVHPDFQGQGIAQELYRSAFEQLKKLGTKFVKVHTGADPAHEPARRAYERAGFNIRLPSVDYYRAL
jgi:ribosomal protein S18 acetylase RimI-like enzyme